MARFKIVNGKKIQLTPEEETSRATEEQAWADYLISTEKRNEIKEKIEERAEKENYKKLKRFKQPIQLVRAITILNKKIDGTALTAGEQNLLDKLTGTIKPDLDAIDAHVIDLKSKIDAASDPNTVDINAGWPT